MVSSCAVSVQLGRGTRLTKRQPASKAAANDSSAVSPSHSPTTHTQSALCPRIRVHHNPHETLHDWKLCRNLCSGRGICIWVAATGKAGPMLLDAPVSAATSNYKCNKLVHGMHECFLKKSA